MTRAQCYQLLHLQPGATEEQIRKQYKRLALKVHPDINPDPRANEQFIQLTRAVEILLRPEQPVYPHQAKDASRKTSPAETEEMRNARMEEAKKRFEQQRAKRQHEDTSYFEQLTTGQRWRVFKWIMRAGIILACVLLLDAVLPHHREQDTFVAFSSNEHNGLLYQRIAAVDLEHTGLHFAQINRSSWLTCYPDATVETTWILHTPIALYLSDDFEIFRTGFDFHLGSVRWLLVLLFLMPLITYNRRRKSLTFVFMYQFCFWGIGLLELYILCSQQRLAHLLTFGLL